MSNRRSPGKAAKIAAQMHIGICSNVCVPVEFDFTLDLPTQGNETQQRSDPRRPWPINLVSAAQAPTCG
jgi:DsbC/DsbD-like thiol-disulfide interchange protein